MKCSIRTVALVLTLAPAAVFAQSAQSSNEPLTHAQVMHQLTQLRQDGYRPSKIHYPNDIQAAEARVATQDGTNMTSSSSGFGGTSSETMQSGSPTTTITTSHVLRPMYGHH